MIPGVTINRKIVREASHKFLSSIPQLKEDEELFKATVEDLTSIMIRALLLSLESDNSDVEPTESEEEHREADHPLSNEEEMRRRSEEMRTSFLAKLQQRVNPPVKKE
jgi:hypothetical protein